MAVGDCQIGKYCIIIVYNQCGLQNYELEWRVKVTKLLPILLIFLDTFSITSPAYAGSPVICGTNEVCKHNTCTYKSYHILKPFYEQFFLWLIDRVYI